MDVNFGTSLEISLKEKPWATYVEEDIRELLQESQILLKVVPQWGEKFHDYSFVVFPAAKAYEGFLKKFFLDMKFITEEDYFGKHFRIGKALNPAIRRDFPGTESIYDKVAQHCGGKDLANTLWETWRECRNLVFHWFPNEKNAITMEMAQSRFEMIINAIDRSFAECKINK